MIAVLGQFQYCGCQSVALAAAVVRRRFNLWLDAYRQVSLISTFVPQGFFKQMDVIPVP